VFLNSGVSDSLSAELGYAYSLTPSANLSASLSYLDSQLDSVFGAGIGDPTLTFSRAPGVDISISPWVPRQIGTGISMILPTGKTSEGHSLGATVVAPFVGLVFPIGDSFSIFPGAMYMRSLDKTFTGKDLDLAVLDLGGGWLSSKGTWIRLYVALIRDLKSDESYYNSAISVGRVLFANCASIWVDVI